MADKTKYRFGNYNCGEERIIINEKTANKAVEEFIKVCEKEDESLEKSGKKAVHAGTVKRIKMGVSSGAMKREVELKEKKSRKVKKDEKG